MVPKRGLMISVAFKRNWTVLTFKPNVNIERKLSFVVGHCRDPKTNDWMVPTSESNIKYLKKLFGGMLKFPGELTEEVLTTDETSSFTFKTVPMKHQMETFTRFKDSNAAGLFLEMGLGKSKIIIDILSYRFYKYPYDKVLFLCPNNVTETIEEEFEKHSSYPFKVCVLQGPKEKKVKLIQAFKDDVYILNYESVTPLYSTLYDKFKYIVCDESTRIKTFSSSVTKAVCGLGSMAKNKYIMSGRPVTQGCIDLFGQYKFLDSTIFGQSYYAFRGRYAVMGGYMSKQIMSYRNMAELQRKMFSIAVRYTKEECLDLPEKVYEIRRFDLSVEERKLYDEFKENAIMMVGDAKVTSAVMLTRIIKLHEITSGFVKDDAGNTILFNSSKLCALDEVLDDILPNKVIVWAWFTADINNIHRLLTKRGVQHVVYSGATPQKDRQACIHLFQENCECLVFVVQIQTASMGITLTAAAYSVYYSNTYSLNHRCQSEDRCHRIGQTKNVTYIDLIARKTIDESIHKILRSKLKLSDIMMDRSRMIEFIKGGALD